MKVLGSVLTLYNWTVVALLLLFQFLIARFYEKKSGQRSYYVLFLLPAILFLVAAIWNVFAGGDLTGNIVGDSLLFVGGTILAVLSTFLFRLMMGGKR